jgi:hypothetical protein
MQGTIREFEGAVCVLDALGSQQLSASSAVDFIRTRNNILLYTKAICIPYNETYIRYNASDNTTQNFKVVGELSGTMFTFGDTILVYWEKPKNLDNMVVLRIAAQWISRFMLFSLEYGLLFRGSLSYGNVVSDDQSTVIGPAVADAAQWYDKIKLVSVIVTPNTASIINIDNEVMHPYGTDNSELFQEYSTATSIGSRSLIHVLWPLAIIEDMNLFDDNRVILRRSYTTYRHYIYDKLTVMPAFYSTEDKHINTVAFFDYCVQLYAKLHKLKKPQR